MPQIKRQLPPSNRTNSVHIVDLFESAVAVSELPMSGMKVLVFGLSGTGKTTYGSTFPKPLLVIRPEEVEEGTKSISTVSGVFVSPPITDPDQLDQIVQGQRSTKRYKTIVLDGITRFQDHVIRKHMGWQDVAVQLTYGSVPQTDWNAIGLTLKQHMRDLLRLAEDGTHIVLIGGERTVGETDNKNVILAQPTIMVNLTPGTSGFIHEICDYNFHTFKRRKVERRVKDMAGKKVTVDVQTDEMEFCMHITEQELYGTKFRRPKSYKVPPEISDPSYDKIAALVQEAEKHGV